MKKNDVRFLVDYFCFTLSRLQFLGEEGDEHFIFERIQAKLFLRGLDYTERRSFYGYNISQVACGVSICYGGREDIYIQMSGQGCRAFESLHPDLSWEQYIGYLQSTYSSLHVSRLDVACDTFGLLKIATIQQYTIARRFVSKWRTYLCQIGSNENSVIFGASSSDFRLRIYDKTAERREKTGREDVPENWVRCEYQMRNETSASFMRSWFGSGDLPGTFLGIMRNQLLYWTKFDGRHYERMQIASWWLRLLDNKPAIKMAYMGGLEYNLESLRDYVIGQAGSSVRAYIEAFGAEQLLATVAERPLNDKQKALLASAEVIAAPWERI